MTQRKEYPNIAPGQCVYEDTCWKLFRQDADMGETEYSLFRFDIFFCTCDQRKNADYILKLIHSRPHPAPAPTYQELVDFARWTQTFWKNGIEIMRKNGLVIKSDAPMEKLAFTFYTDLCEIDREAQHLFQEGYKDENYKDETAIESRTIKSYPKPYEERIARKAREESQQRIDAVIKELGHLRDGQYNDIVGHNVRYAYDYAIILLRQQAGDPR